MNSAELAKMNCDWLSDGYDDEEFREETETALYNELSQISNDSFIKNALLRLCERVEELAWVNMVNTYGRWTEEKDYSTYPKEKWCDYDYMADAIRKSGYEIKTTMENLITMIFLYVDSAIDDGVDIIRDSDFDIMCWVKESGGLQEFDYYA